MKKEFILYKSELDGANTISVNKQLLKAGTNFTPHWHDYFEYEIIVAGTAKHIYNNKMYEIIRGDAYLMNYCDYHALLAVTDVELYNVKFYAKAVNEELAQYLSSGARKLQYSFDETELCDIIKKLDRLAENIQNGGAFSPQLSSAILTEIIIYIIQKSCPDATYYTPTLIQRAMAYIHSNFRFDMSLDQMANELSVTVNYMGAVFKKWVGMSFNEYLNTVRLRNACNMLETTNLSIKEIAFASGYKSVEYFLYKFKDKLKITPGKYRKGCVRMKSF